VSDQLDAASRFASGKRALLPTGRDSGWISEPVWTRWRREKIAAYAGYRNMVFQA